MAESTITSKGQITIPKVVRERLQLEPGDRVYFDVRDDGSVSMMTRKHPIESLFGLLKGKVKLKRPITIDEMNPASLDDRDK
jgi:AbrB family looped-hinge helix DNA binding protein